MPEFEYLLYIKSGRSVCSSPEQISKQINEMATAQSMH